MRTRTRRRLAALVVFLIVGIGAAVGVKGLRDAQRQRVIERRLEAATAAYEAGDYEAALPDLAFVYSRSRPREPELVHRLADARRRVPAPDGRHLSEAVTYASEAVRLDPEHLAARRMLLDLLIRTGARAEALAAAERILEIEPRDKETMLRRVALLRASGRNAEAVSAGEALAAAHPSDREARSALLGLMIATGRDEAEVLEEAARASQAVGDPLAGALLEAGVLLELRHAGEAVDRIGAAGVEGITDIDKLRRLVRLLDAAALRDQGALAQAVELAQRALATHAAGLDGEVFRLARAWRRPDPSAIADAAERLRGVGQLDAAGRAWLAIAGGGEPPAQHEGEEPMDAAWRLLAEAHALAAAGRHREALETLPRAGAQIGLADASGEAVAEARELSAYLRSEALAGLGATSESERRLQEIAALPAWGRARLRLAQVQLMRSRPRDAMRTLLADRAITDMKPGAIALVSAAVMVAEDPIATQSDRRRALDFARALLDAGVEPGIALPLAVRAAAAAGEPATAAQFAGRLGEAEGAPAGEVLLAARAVARTAPEAERILVEAVSRRDGDDPDLLLHRAGQLAQDGRADDGVRLLTEAAGRAKGRERLELERRLARLLDGLGRRDQAVEVLRRLAAREESVEAQEEVLRSRAAWNDDDLLADAIANLRALTGEAAPGWRKFEARRILVHATHADAPGEALALVSEVLERNPGDAEALLLAAEAWSSLGNREMAIESLERAIDEGVSEPSIYPRLVGLLLEAGRTNEIRGRMAEYLRFDDLSLEQARQRAGLLERFGMAGEAVRERRRIAEATGEEGDRLALAGALESGGQAGEARKVFEDALAGEPSDAARLAAANFFARRGDVERAFATARPAMGEGPEAAIAEAELLDLAGETERAISLVREHAEAGGGPELWLWLSRRLARAGDEPGAFAAAERGLALHAGYEPLAALRDALAGEPAERKWALLAALAGSAAAESESEVASELASVLRRAGRGELDADGLTRELRSLVRQHPRVYDARRLLAEAELARGDADAAVRTMLATLDLFPGEERAARDAALLFERLGRTSDALAAGERWRERTGRDDIEPASLIARLELRRGRAEAALRVLEPFGERVLAQGAERLATLRTLLASEIAVGRAGEAQRHLRDARVADVQRTAIAASLASEIATPDARRAWIAAFLDEADLDGATRLELARGWVELGQRTNAPEAFAAAIDLLQGAGAEVEAAHLRAAAHLGMGDRAGAEGVWRRVLADRPDAPRALLSLARLLLGEEGRTDEAAALASRAAEHAQGPVERLTALDLLAEAAIRKGDLDAARQAAMRGLQEDPRSPLLAARLAEIALRRGQTDVADEALARLPDADRRTETAMALAQRLEAAELLEAAEWLYTRMLRDDPEAYAAGNNLAFLHVRLSRVTEETVRVAEQALAAARARGAGPAVEGVILDTLGHARLAAGDAPGARRAFLQATDLRPEAVSSRIGLAIALWQDGSAGAARSALAEAETRVGQGLEGIEPFLRERLEAARQEIR